MYKKINYPKGKNFKLAFVNPSNGYIIDRTGTMITLAKHGLKYGIGSRVYYETFEDAFEIASLWRSLIVNSTTGYRYGIIIYDTNEIPNLWGKYIEDITENRYITIVD